MATTITTQPTRGGVSLMRTIGDLVALTVEVSVDPGETGLTVQWFRGDETFGAARSVKAKRGIATDTLTFDVVDISDASAYHAAITDRAGTTLMSESVELLVQAAAPEHAGHAAAANPAPPVEDAEGLLIYDRSFATRSASILVGVFVLVMLPVLLVEGRKTIRELNVVWVVSLALLLTGVAIALAGVFMVLLEVRGHILTVEEHAKLRDSGVNAKGALDLDKYTSLIEAFGRLRSPLAVLAMSAVPLLGAAWVAHDGGQAPVSPATSTVVRPSTATVAPGPSSTAEPASATTRAGG